MQTNNNSKWQTTNYSRLQAIRHFLFISDTDGATYALTLLLIQRLIPLQAKTHMKSPTELKSTKHAMHFNALAKYCTKVSHPTVNKCLSVGRGKLYHTKFSLHSISLSHDCGLQPGNWELGTSQSQRTSGTIVRHLKFERVHDWFVFYRPHTTTTCRTGTESLYVSLLPVQYVRLVASYGGYRS